MANEILCGTFSEACYETNTITELEEGLKGVADPSDMKEWGITNEEWYSSIALALATLKEEN